MKLNFLVYTLTVLSLLACKPVSNTATNSAGSSDSTDLTKRHQISLMEISSNQLIINGTNLNTVSAVKAKYGPQVIGFNIDSKSDSTLRLSVPNGMKLIAGYIYDLVITDAFGQSTTSVSFDVQDNSISTNKIQDGSITNSKLSSLGASSGQLLQYDGSAWVAVDYIGGNNYLGRRDMDPGGGVVPISTAGVNNGDYYVVSDPVPVTGNVNGDATIETYTAGDIIRYNEATDKWDLQLNSSSYVGPWDVSGSNIRRTNTGKVTISDTATDGPTKLSVGTEVISVVTPEDSILLSVNGAAPFGSGQWSRAMSFGLRSEHNATMGVYGAGSSDADFFFIDANSDTDGLLPGDIWTNADFFIENSTGNVSIGGAPTPGGGKLQVKGDLEVAVDLNVAGNLTASNISGNGSAITGVNATSMSNLSTTNIESGTGGAGNIAFRAVSSNYAIYDQAGNLSFGHTTDAGSFAAGAQLDVRNESADAKAQFYSYGGNQSSINLATSQGSIISRIGTNTSDVLGEINFGGDTGGSILNTASIQSQASENFTPTSLGSQIGFFTTANGTTILQENMRLTNDGRLLLGNSEVADATTRRLVVGGDSQLGGNVNVTGTTSLAGTNITGTVAHTGAYNLTGSLSVSTTAGVTGLLTTNGITNASGVFQNIGATDLDSTLDVAGNAQFAGDVDVVGTLSAGDLEVTNITGTTITSTATFGEVTSQTKFVSAGDASDIILKDAADNFEIKVTPTGTQIGNIDNAQNRTLSFWTNGTQNISMLATGEVGIGTAAPTEKLDVNGNVQGTQLCIAGDCRSAWPDAPSVVVDGVTVDLDGLSRIRVADGGISNAKLQSGIDAAKLTIGTVADARLSTNVSLLGQTITSNEIVDLTLANIDISATANIDWGKINKTGALASDVNAIALSDLDTTATLGVDDTKVPSQAAVKTYVDTETAAVASAANTYTDTQVAAINQSQWITNGTDIEYSAGSVGIGTAAPSEALHIVGNLRVQGTTDCILGNGSGATNCTSDRRLKDNIENIDNALDKIKALNGVSFDWNENSISPGMHSIGVIAQDVQAQFPTAVIKNSDGWLAVDYAVLVSPLIEAVKELDKNLEMYKVMSEGIEARVDENTRAIASLKEENADLKKENKQMKEALCSMNSSFEFCK